MEKSYNYADKEHERAAALWLCAITGLEQSEKNMLMRTYENAENVYKAAKKGLSEGFTDRVRKIVGDAAQRLETERINEELWRISARFIWRDDEKYPEKLRDIPMPPLGFFLIGSLPDPKKPAIAVVGARACSSYGISVCDRFSGKLTEGGVQIISGLAQGIDGISHRAAIKAGGKTYAVLGNGIGTVYPAENEAIYAEILSGNGGIISEYYIGSKGLRQHFPERNRIIAGLSDGVLVIEARKKSGTMITVNHSLEQGKDVFVIPGRIDSDLSSGCNELIQKGAMLVTCVEDIAFALKDKYPEHITYYKDKDSQYSFGRLQDVQKPELGADEKKILSFIKEGAEFFDELMGLCSMDYFALMEVIDSLIDKKIVTEKEGRFIV